MSGLAKGLFGAVAKQYQGIVASRCAAIGKLCNSLMFCITRDDDARFYTNVSKLAYLCNCPQP